MTFHRLADGKWAHTEGRTYHKHDVRAMASYESGQIKMIVSGGKVHQGPSKCRSRPKLLSALVCGFKRTFARAPSCTSKPCHEIC
jgi:hypothetical protein